MRYGYELIFVIVLNIIVMDRFNYDNKVFSLCDRGGLPICKQTTK